MTRHILITGASSGIGAATARLLAGPDVRLSLGARRVERLPSELPDSFCHQLDVTDETSVEAFIQAAVDEYGPVDVLVNNAGLARGRATVAEGDDRAWREMIETNVMGVLHMTRRILPSMIERRTGHLVMIGSIAGLESYPGGSVYCASKRAVSSITEAIRLETLGTNIKTTRLDPGLVETEFSVVRFRGDQEKADKVYENTNPLTAHDIAECVAFAISRPANVCIDTMLIKATDQGGATLIHRGGRA